MATRQQIRLAVKRLIANRVKTCFDFRPGQLHETELPVASIFFENGDTDRDYQEQGVTTGRLLIEINARTSGAIDIELDLMGSLIESDIRSVVNLDGLVHLIQRNGFQYDRDPESLDASLTLFFNVIYDDED
ncbi:phage tail terminator protein [Glaciecola sp. KUL10]|uniref:phage tail terminator protein n=1 Tax=Glaciecola sp. (strain KUL10) TaxID=2161813 RepID=UPI000D78A222|nr:phage tail terminator protein [Glaciecola sp. KUL10]GBL02933.1 minor tail protein U [Glaciecola sp. KUL10]